MIDFVGRDSIFLKILLVVSWFRSVTYFRAVAVTCWVLWLTLSNVVELLTCTWSQNFSKKRKWSNTSKVHTKDTNVRPVFKMGFKSGLNRKQIFLHFKTIFWWQLDVVLCNFVDSLNQPPKIYEVVDVGMISNLAEFVQWSIQKIIHNRCPSNRVVRCNVKSGGFDLILTLTIISNDPLRTSAPVTPPPTKRTIPIQHLVQCLPRKSPPPPQCCQSG